MLGSTALNLRQRTWTEFIDFKPHLAVIDAERLLQGQWQI